MTLPREYSRRTLIPVAGLILLAYIFVVYLPLSRRAKSLEEPVQKAWRRLAAALDQTNTTTIDFAQLTNQLSETRQALAVLENTKKEAAARLGLSSNLQEKLTAPFQLVDYENARSKQLDELERQAKEQKITVDPAVYSGFPEHT